ncbi:rhodanese-like domain-containing protein [Rhodoferax bucti]|uniref:rhodanese-like domain-containing protein n=1 Tax=Rhodoferax bucti TaxID=2576305 RepID=UPI0011097806|nr:rhodanese-like domain-containing protein [Rhodoferax bucti]
MKTLFASITLALTMSLGALSAQAKDVIIDVRSPQEFAAGHVEGAINIEHTAIAQEIAKAGVTKDDKVMLYCQSGRRSGMALDTLKGLGFSKAENVGGIEQARKTLAKK